MQLRQKSKRKKNPKKHASTCPSGEANLTITSIPSRQNSSDSVVSQTGREELKAKGLP